MEQLGDRVKRLRKDRKVKPEVLAVALNVSAQTIRNLENNKGIRAERLAPLSRFLGVSADYLLGLEDENGKPIELAATALEGRGRRRRK